MTERTQQFRVWHFNRCSASWTGKDGTEVITDTGEDTKLVSSRLTAMLNLSQACRKQISQKYTDAWIWLMILHWLIGDIFYFFNTLIALHGMLFISAGLITPWANPEADLGWRQMATCRSGCAAADASDLSYFSSMAIRDSSLFPSLIGSGFTWILLLSLQNHRVKPDFQSNFEANSSPSILSAERGQKLSAVI